MPGATLRHRARRRRRRAARDSDAVHQTDVLISRGRLALRVYRAGLRARLACVAQRTSRRVRRA